MTETNAVHGRAATAERHRLGLRARTALALALVGLVVSVTLGVLAFELTRNYLVDKRIGLVRREAALNARFIDGSIAEEPDAIGDVLRDVSDDASPVLVRTADRWFGATVGVGQESVPSALRDAVGRGGAAVQIARWDGHATAFVGVPLPRSESDFYQLFPLDELEGTLDVIRNSLIAAAVVTTIASALLGLVASRRLLLPLREIAGTARMITEGDMTARLDDEDDPDLMPLVTSFNEMAAALEERIRRERRFAADVSHELRTPLTALGSAVHIIDRRSQELSGPGREAVEVLHKQVEQFTRVVLDILDLSRLESGNAEVSLQEVDLSSFMTAIADESGLPAGAIEIDPALPSHVVVDVRRLRVLVRNLLENAQRYAGGCTRLAAVRTPAGWSIEVDDHGPGVEPSERLVLFERFRRGDASSGPGSPKGTGLGLALVSENAKALGGSVHITDPPHRGARFVVELPLETEDVAIEAAGGTGPR